MYTPQLVASLLIIYTAFVAGACAVCHFLLKSTASNLVSAQYATAVKTQNSYSRVEGWLRRQAMANLKKSTVTTVARASSNPVPNTTRAEPGRDVARAVVMAAAIDSAEQNRTGVSEADQDQVRNAQKRVRVLSCRELPCDQAAQLAAETAYEISLAKPDAKVASLNVVAQTSKKAVRRAARTSGVQVAGKTSPKLQHAGAKSKAAASANAVAQARIKSQKEIALRRLIETPAQISYRSFVGSFVPAT